nr:multimodular transpeptidase-transglycosylase [uncultured bacterium]
MQLVRQELQAKLGDKVKDLSGVKIFTTFDSVAQDAAEKSRRGRHSGTEETA